MATADVELPLGGLVPSQHRLSPSELSHFREHGYVVAKAVFSRNEAAALRVEAHALVERLRATGQAPAMGTQKDGGWGSASLVDDGPRALSGCHNVQFHSALFARMITDPRLVERASDIIVSRVSRTVLSCSCSLTLTGRAGPQRTTAPHQALYQAPRDWCPVSNASGRSLLRTRGALHDRCGGTLR